MKPQFTKAFTIAILTAAIAGAPGTSLALFGFGGTKAKLLEQADEAYGLAETAKSEGRVMDEINALNDAMGNYHKLATEHPGYKDEHVVEHFNAAHARRNELMTKIGKGEITIPDPSQIAAGEGKGYVAQSKPSEDGQPLTSPAFNHSIPPLMPAKEAADLLEGKPLNTTEAVRAVLSNEPADVRAVETTRAATAPPPKETPAPAPAPAAVAETPAPDGPDAQEYISDGVFPSRVKSFAEADDFGRRAIVEQLVKSGEAPDAVLVIEDVLETEGDKTSLATRLLFVRALMECRNYSRAAEELKGAAASNPTNPAVRTFAAALAMQRGDYTEAVFQMDRLVLDHPAYSDAYINMAYLYLMMDPAKNRDMAVVYYRTALAYGAQRDPRLESELNIEIQK